MHVHGTETKSPAGKAEQAPDEVSDAGPGPNRWTHICAWDGHELGAMEYVQISAYERVCRFHLPQFQTWLYDKSKAMYRAEGADVETSDEEDHPVSAPS